MNILKNKRNKLILAVSAIVIVGVILYISVFDSLSHGFYCSVPAYSSVSSDNLLEKIDLAQEEYVQKFIPSQRHFAGFEILLQNMVNDEKGDLIVTLLDNQDKVVEQQTIALTEFKNETWHMIHTKSNFKHGEVYKVAFSTQNAIGTVNVQLVKNSYIPSESKDGNLLLGYAYHNSTFILSERCFIAILLIAAWMIVASFFIKSSKKVTAMHIASAFLILTVALAWNYMFNSIDSKNTFFVAFQQDSETLVSSMIEAENNNVDISFRYGLGRYHNAKGSMYAYDTVNYPSDNNWDNGYSKTEPVILLSENEYTKEVAVKGNAITFANGKTLSIEKVEASDQSRKVYLNTQEVLTYANYGNLDQASFINSSGEKLECGKITEYASQYGLQGKIFTKLYKYVKSIDNLNLLCALGTASVFSLIIILIRKKYNVLMACCFFVTFLLSPWIINFARNLYWVEFTWFLPMLAGLICSIWIEKKWCRIFSYIFAFIAILVKCLCGYEYITTIMLGMISFLLVDFVVSLISKNKEKAKQILKTTIIVGIVALFAFAAAIVLHAQIKGNGGIIEGIKLIIKNDVLRRTNGGDLNDFAENLWPSLNASIWEVLCKYFHFSTEIITGIEGNVFAIISGLPVLIFVYNIAKKKCDYTDMSMYIVFFLTSISWFVLAKSHSYVHTHMNFVLWYFGYIQICFYIIVKQVIDFLKEAKHNDKEITF